MPLSSKRTRLKTPLKNPHLKWGFFFIDLASPLHETSLLDRKLYQKSPMLPVRKFETKSFHRMKRWLRSKNSLLLLEEQGAKIFYGKISEVKSILFLAFLSHFHILFFVLLVYFLVLRFYIKYFLCNLWNIKKRNPSWRSSLLIRVTLVHQKSKLLSSRLVSRI